MAFLGEFGPGGKYHDGTNLLDVWIALYINCAKVTSLMNRFMHKPFLRNRKAESGRLPVAGVGDLGLYEPQCTASRHREIKPSECY